MSVHDSIIFVGIWMFARGRCGVTNELTKEPVLPPLLYVYSDSEESGCGGDHLLLARTGHVWRVFRAKAMFTREPSALVATWLASQALDPHGRYRCSTESRYQDAAKQELDRLGLRSDHLSPGLCHFYNASDPQHHVIASLRLRQRCAGRFLGAISHADHEILDAVAISPLRKPLAEAFPETGGWNSAALHDAVEARALQWRWGTDISILNDCSRSCCLECGFCSWPDQMDLPWLLSHILKADQEIRFLNWGCGEFSSIDPLFPFVFEKNRQTGLPWNVKGLCVESAADLAIAAIRNLESAGVNGVTVLQTRLVPDGQFMRDLLIASRVKEEFVPAFDILKVDIDSFDLKVTLATLDALQHLGVQLPVALVVETSVNWPPPLEVVFSLKDASSFEQLSDNPLRCLNSLMAFVAQLWDYGYRLNRISYGNALFLQDAVSDSVQDEWNCFFQMTADRSPKLLAFARQVLQADAFQAQQMLMDWCEMKQRLIVQ